MTQWLGGAKNSGSKGYVQANPEWIWQTICSIVIAVGPLYKMLGGHGQHGGVLVHLYNLLCQLG